MTHPTREQLNELADKWLKGKLTLEEKELLNEWYDFNTSAPINWPGSDESELELGGRLLSHIHRRKNTHFLFSRSWKISFAAIILITLGMGSYFYVSKQPDVEPIVFKDKIEPGKNQATLTLANGQKINLTDALNGEVLNKSGLHITKTADGKLIYHTAGTASAHVGLEYNTLQTPIGGQWEIYLPDGSLVVLNAASSITYPTRFTGDERKVLLKGEGYFEIVPNKKMPFRVESNEQLVEVLGTHFNVMAYADEKVIKTTLLEGSVKISHHAQTKLLKPGEQAQVAQNSITLTREIDLEDIIAWKNGYFKFNENLESIMAKIARWYDVKIEYQFKPDPELTFSGKISRARNITEILKRLEYNGDVHFKIEGRRVIVTR